MAKRGLELSPVSEILIEESLLGWKEFEMEVMRDRKDNCVDHLLHRELRPDGRPYRRFHHRGARSRRSRTRNSRSCATPRSP